MKPKYSRFRSIALPAVIVFTGLYALSSADTRFVDADGNLIITSDTNAADTILADGGTDTFPDETPTVALESGAVITGDPTFGTGIDVQADGYTIVNNGTLSGDREGIFTTSSDLTVFNTAFATIEGGVDGISAGDNFTLVNETLALVNGIDGFGVSVGDTATIFNDPTATISGGIGGIDAFDDAQITNGGNIFGNEGAGIGISDNGLVDNTGLIIGSVGIDASFGTIGSEIINSGEIRSNLDGGDAILLGSGDDTITLNEGSLITGSVIGNGGTDTLTFNGGLTSPGSPQNSIRGDVFDFSTITKEGGGVALIGTVADVGSNFAVIADTININGGGLYINADIFSQAENPFTTLTTINANGAALGGTGQWNANVNILNGGFSAGAIPINLDANPENSVGAVAIFGNVTHSPGTFIRFDVIPDTPIDDGINSDLIEQIGSGVSYNLSQTDLRISPTDRNKVITPGVYTIIDSDTPILGTESFGTIGIQFNDNVPDTGRFTTTSTGSNFQGSVLADFFTTPFTSDGGSNLNLLVDYEFEFLPGLTRNQSSLGGALDTLALRAGDGTLGDAEQDLISALALSDLGNVQDALQSLGPDSTFNLTSGIINSGYRINRMVQDHLAYSRANAGYTVSSTPAPMRDAKGGMIQSAPMTRTMSSRGSFWGSVSYDWQDFEDDSSRSDFDGETGAITAGFDYRVSSVFLIGGLIDGSQSDFDTADIDSLRFVLYGTYGEAMGLYSDFLAGYGTHNVEQSRNFFGNNLDSDTDADSFQAMLTVGYSMGTDVVKHGPYAGLEYQRVNLDGFDNGNELFSSSIGDYDADSLRGLIGYRFDATYGAFSPYASIAYAYEFQDGDSARAQIGGVEYSVNGPEQDSSVLITAGSRFTLNPNLVLDLGYRGDISVDDDGITSHGASLGLNYSF